jgi:hypothetical protein
MIKENSKSIVPKEIVENFNKCDMNFACLKNDFNHCCKINDCVNNKIHFVDKLERICPNYLIFGNSHICMCPARIEYYRLTKK